MDEEDPVDRRGTALEILPVSRRQHALVSLAARLSSAWLKEELRTTAPNLRRQREGGVWPRRRATTLSGGW